jgi:hypothetical protein
VRAGGGLSSTLGEESVREIETLRGSMSEDIYLGDMVGEWTDSVVFTIRGAESDEVVSGQAPSAGILLTQ